MKKNTKTILIIIISVLCVAAIALGTILIVRNHKAKEDEAQVISGEGGPEIDENFYNIEVELNEKLVKMFQEVNKEDYSKILHEGESRQITVEELGIVYKIDLTEFEPYNCDYKASYVQIDMMDGHIIYGSFLACEWPEPEEPVE